MLLNLQQQSAGMFRFIDSDFVVDFYQRLRIARDASEDEIRKAYRKRARDTHPDTNPKNKNAHAEFIAVGRAYECLTDPNLRVQYDGRLGGINATFSKAKARTPARSENNIYDEADFARYAGQYNHFKETYGYTDEMINDYVSAETRLSTGRGRSGDLSTVFGFNAGSLKPKTPAPKLDSGPQNLLD